VRLVAGTLAFQQLTTETEGKSGQEGVAAGFIDLDDYLPDPSRIIEKAQNCQAKCLVILAKDPVPCNTPEPPKVDCPTSPIAFWINSLRPGGFPQVALGFDPNGSVTIVAAKAGDPSLMLSSEQRGSEKAITVDPGDAKNLLVVPHSGLSSDQGRLSFDGLGVLYVLNRTTDIISANVELTLKTTEAGARIRSHLDFCYLDESPLKADEEIRLRLPDVVLTPGGHGIQLLSTEGERIEVAQASFKTSAYPLARYQVNLPCDQYQRHRIVADALGSLAQDKKLDVLDVGGGTGILSAFLTGHRVTVLDQRPYDTPQHVKSTGENLPFGDGSFDVVTSVDALEHVPSEKREAFIRELWRVSRRWVFLACPFKDKEVEEAEQLLVDFHLSVRQKENPFLNEHLQNGLPDREMTLSLLKSLSGATVAIPNGFLPRWFSMMVFRSMLETALDCYPRLQSVKVAYNRGYYAFDNGEPCYRYLLIASKDNADSEILAAVAEQLTSKETSGNPALLDPKSTLEFYDIPLSDAFLVWYGSGESRMPHS